MSNLLKQLGDNWHAEHVYLSLIERVVPASLYKTTIENLLLELYVDEQNGYRLFTNKNFSTVFDEDIDLCKAKKKEVEEDLEKEDKQFKKLLDKFQELETAEASSDEEGAKEKKPSKNALKSGEQHKKILVKGIKSSMASSQQKLMDLNEYIQQLEKKGEHFVYFQKATQQYLRATREAVHRYIETKNLESLIVQMDTVIDQHETMMRRYVPSDPCRGYEGGICETHLLPLITTIIPSDGYRHVMKCKVSP